MQSGKNAVFTWKTLQSRCLDDQKKVKRGYNRCIRFGIRKRIRITIEIHRKALTQSNEKLYSRIALYALQVGVARCGH